MPRTKGAKDRKDRRPKGAGKDYDINLGQERQIEQYDDWDTNSGAPADFSEEVNKSISAMGNEQEQAAAAVAAAEKVVAPEARAEAGAGGKTAASPAGAGEEAAKTAAAAAAGAGSNDDDLPDNPPVQDYSAVNDADVIERDYSVNPTLQDTSPIPEPVIIPPSFEDNIPPTPGELQKQEKKAEPLNPDLADKTAEEKLRGAEMMADGAIEVYAGLWQMGYSFVEVKEEKIGQLDLEDKIDASQVMHLPGGDVTCAQFMQSLNRQAKDILTVGDDFKDKVRPPLVREFNRRGLGASDMQYLIFTVGKDALTRGSAIVGLKMTVNNVLKVFQQQHQENKNGRIELEEIGNRVNELEEAGNKLAAENNKKASTIAELKKQVQAAIEKEKALAEELKKVKTEKKEPEPVKSNIKITKVPKKGGRSAMREPEEG